MERELAETVSILAENAEPWRSYLVAGWLVALAYKVIREAATRPKERA